MNVDARIREILQQEGMFDREAPPLDTGLVFALCRRAYGDGYLAGLTSHGSTLDALRLRDETIARLPVQ